MNRMVVQQRDRNSDQKQITYLRSPRTIGDTPSRASEQDFFDMAKAKIGASNVRT